MAEAKELEKVTLPLTHTIFMARDTPPIGQVREISVAPKVMDIKNERNEVSCRGELAVDVAYHSKDDESQVHHAQINVPMDEPLPKTWAGANASGSRITTENISWQVLTSHALELVGTLVLAPVENRHELKADTAGANISQSELAEPINDANLNFVKTKKTTKPLTEAEIRAKLEQPDNKLAGNITNKDAKGPMLTQQKVEPNDKSQVSNIKLTMNGSKMAKAGGANVASDELAPPLPESKPANTMAAQAAKPNLEAGSTKPNVAGTTIVKPNVSADELAPPLPESKPANTMAAQAAKPNLEAEATKPNMAGTTIVKPNVSADELAPPLPETKPANTMAAQAAKPNLEAAQKAKSNVEAATTAKPNISAAETAETKVKVAPKVSSEQNSKAAEATTETKANEEETTNAAPETEKMNSKAEASENDAAKDVDFSDDNLEDVWDNDEMEPEARVMPADNLPRRPYAVTETVGNEYRLKFYLVHSDEGLGPMASKHQVSKESIEPANQLSDEKTNSGMALNIPK